MEPDIDYNEIFSYKNLFDKTFNYKKKVKLYDLIYEFNKCIYNLDYINARVYINKILKLEPTSQNLNKYAHILIKLKDFTKLEDILKEIILLNPFEDRAYVNLALCYLKLHQQKKAIQQLQYAIKLNPTNIQTKIYLINIYRNNGYIFDILYEVDIILQIEPNNIFGLNTRIRVLHIISQIAKDYNMIYNHQIDIRTYEDLNKIIFKYRSDIQLYPTNLLIKLAYGNLYFRLHQLNMAIEIFNEIVEIDNTYILAYYNLFHIYILINDIDNLEKTCTSILALNPTHTKANYYMTLIEYDRTDIYKAHSELLEAFSD